MMSPKISALLFAACGVPVFAVAKGTPVSNSRPQKEACHNETCPASDHVMFQRQLKNTLKIHIKDTDGGGGGGDGQSCATVWNKNACTGQFGHEECYTCGARIDWLKSRGKSDELAKQQVAMDFLQPCGPCAPTSLRIQNESDGYSVVWEDQFNIDGEVDTSKWEMVNKGGGFGNNEHQHYTNRRENAWIEGGVLKIKAKKENYGGDRYTSGKLTSKADWIYGKFSFRTKLTEGTARGTWPANWMMPRDENYGGWPNSGEIDIMEHVGYDPNKIYGTVHTGAYNHMRGTQIGGSMEVDVKQWHTYTAEWRSDIILFACDDIVYQVFRRESGDFMKWPFDQKFYLILNLAVGGNWGGQKGIDEDAFRDGQIMEIDWVKVEQKV